MPAAIAQLVTEKMTLQVLGGTARAPWVLTDKSGDWTIFRSPFAMRESSFQNVSKDEMIALVFNLDLQTEVNHLDGEEPDSCGVGFLWKQVAGASDKKTTFLQVFRPKFRMTGDPVMLEVSPPNTPGSVPKSPRLKTRGELRSLDHLRRPDGETIMDHVFGEETSTQQVTGTTTRAAIFGSEHYGGKVSRIQKIQTCHIFPFAMWTVIGFNQVYEQAFRNIVLGAAEEPERAERNVMRITKSHNAKVQRLVKRS